MEVLSSNMQHTYFSVFGIRLSKQLIGLLLTTLIGYAISAVVAIPLERNIK